MEFLPKNYSIPNESNYMKFEQGTNKFRVMGSAVVGYEWWVENTDGSRKPQRRHTFQEAVRDGIEPLKHFWVFPVWNYKSAKLQILELTQKSIMKVIEEYAKNEDWGSPTDYDLTVTKKGDGLETEYTVIASPHKPVLVEALTAFKQMPVNLEALFTNEDPFKKQDFKDLATEVDEALK